VKSVWLEVAPYNHRNSLATWMTCWTASTASASAPRSMASMASRRAAANRGGGVR
jgi:hypothetical protein